MRLHRVCGNKKLNANSIADHGPKERWQHSGYLVEVTERAGVLALRATEENLLDVLLLRRFISSVERDAGMRFRADYHAAGLEARIVGSYDPTRGCSRSNFRGFEMSDEEEMAYSRWRKALRVLGIALSDAVISTVCLDEWPANKQLVKAKQGLAVLVNFYGV